MSASKSGASKIRVLFITGAPALPQMIGGSQIDSHVLITRLVGRGHVVALSAALMGRGLTGWRSRFDLKIRRRGFSSDQQLGYLVYRSWDSLNSLLSVLKSFQPDVCVVLAHRTGEIACRLRELGVPFILSLQDAEFDNTIDHFRRLRGAPAVANSQFTSNAYKRFNIDARVIHPPIERHLYLTERTGTKVLLVNPVEEKGVSLAIEVAKLVPEIQFKFLLTWPLSEDELLDLKAKLDSISNIELAKSCRDMRSAYGEARLLFAPSQWQEGYGRVVTEAQTSGIPVLASNRGGLPESVGNGGIVIRHDAPPNEWAVALQEMLKPRNYEALSKRAKEHAERPELDLDRQISSWETMIENTIRAAAAIRQPAPPAAS